MKSINKPSLETATPRSSGSSSSRSSRKWIWGALGMASALVLGIAVSRRGWPFLFRREKSPNKTVLPTALTAEWQLIEKIDRALQKAHIKGIEVYVKNGKVLLVAAPEKQYELSSARNIILTLAGVESVEISIKAPSLGTSKPIRNAAS